LERLNRLRDRFLPSVSYSSTWLTRLFIHQTPTKCSTCQTIGSQRNGWSACSQETANLAKAPYPPTGPFHSATNCWCEVGELTTFLTHSHPFPTPFKPFKPFKPLRPFSRRRHGQVRQKTLVASKQPKPSTFLAAPSRLADIAREWFHPLSYTAAGQNSARDYLLLSTFSPPTSDGARDDR